MTPCSLTCTDFSVLSDIFLPTQKQKKNKKIHRYINKKFNIFFSGALWFMSVLGKTKNEWNYTSTPDELHMNQFSLRFSFAMVKNLKIKIQYRFCKCTDVKALLVVTGQPEILGWHGDYELLIHIISRISALNNYKLTVAHLVKAFLVSCRKIRFITVLKKSHHFSLRRAKLIQSTQKHLIFQALGWHFQNPTALFPM